MARAGPPPASGTGAVRPRVRGHGEGDVAEVLSVDAVARDAAALAERRPTRAELERLAAAEPLVHIDALRAGYGAMEILHGVDLAVGRGQSLCLIGPNGAGKSTVLHAIYGLADVHAGTIRCDGRDITGMASNRKLAEAGIAYVLQDSSIFPDMTVWENLLMGAFLNRDAEAARARAAALLERYERLARRRHQPARVLSGGERRLLEIARALMMDPEVLLIDEPSIGLEPRYIDMVFEILIDLQRAQHKTLIMVEQNARKGLDTADIGYVLVAGEVALAGPGTDLLADPEVGRLFLGG